MSENPPARVQYRYASEYLGKAVWVLATHPKDARGRLSAAYDHIWVVGPELLPENLRDAREEISRRLKKYPGEDDRTSVDMTLSRITNQTASEIARLVVDLYDRLESYIEDKS